LTHRRVNALADSVISLFQTEVIRHAGPWRRLEAAEFATLEWVAWFNTCRLLELLGYLPLGQQRTSNAELLARLARIDALQRVSAEDFVGAREALAPRAAGSDDPSVDADARWLSWPQRRRDA
jgi:hypothetical protein